MPVKKMDATVFENNGVHDNRNYNTIDEDYRYQENRRLIIEPGQPEISLFIGQSVNHYELSRIRKTK
jgi:hypothetical protein